MDINAKMKLAKKANTLAKKTSVSFKETSKTPVLRETSFCGERISYDSCVTYKWEISDLEHRKLL